MKKAVPYILILILLFSLFIYYVRSLHPILLEIFIPFLKARHYAPDYTLFSISHLLDLLNLHLLLSPAGIILLLSLLIVYKKRIKLKEPIIVFLIITSLAQFVYHFSVDPKFGAVRDWDLFSSVALGYTLLGVYLFYKFIESKRYSAMILVFTVFLCALPWFFLNANSDRATQYYESLLNLDLKRSLTGRHTLYTYYLNHLKYYEAAATKAAIYRLFPEDSLFRVAHDYLNQGRQDEGIKLLHEIIDMKPTYGVERAAYNELGLIYLSQKKIDQALEIFQRLTRVDPYNSGVHTNLGYALLDKGRLEEALSELKKAVKLGAGADVYSNIAYIYRRLGETEQVIKALKKALKLDPGLYIAHFGLGQVYLEGNLLDEALAEFIQAQSLKPDYAPVYYHLGLVYDLKGLKEKAIEQFELFLKYSSDEAQNQQVRGWIKELGAQK